MTSRTPTDDVTTLLESLRREARDVLEPRLGIDLRALAAFRIALGLVVLGDLLLVRLPGVWTFYTDNGVFPRSTLAELYPGFEAVSLHALSGGWLLQVVLLAIGVVAAACLVVGYRTRLATILSALLLASLHARNPLVLNGGDTVLLSLLVFGAFLPLEARWSIDARRNGSASANGDRLFSIATAAVLVHFVTIYAVNGALKFESESWMAGTAAPRIFQLEQYVVWLGPLVADWGSLLVVANWVWTALLCGSVLLLVVTARLRIALVAAFVGAQLGLGVTMRLGAFPFAMIAALLLFLPPRVWDRLEAMLANRVGPGRPSAVDRLPGGRVDSPTVPPRVKRGARVARSIVIAVVLVSIVTWQLAGAGLVDPPSPDVSEGIEDASWSFFAPNPPEAYWWYAWEADLENGETVDTLYANGEIDRPPDAADRDPSVLWKRYGTELRYSGTTPYEPLAEYRCERVAQVHDADPETLSIYYVEQPVTADGPVGEPTAEKRLERAC